MLRIQHRFDVANTTWTNGTVEQVMHEMLKASKAILHERGSLLSEWVTVLPSLQSALNTAVARKRYSTLLFHVMLGNGSRTLFAVLMEKGELELTKFDLNRLRAHVKGMVNTQEQVRKEW